MIRKVADQQRSSLQLAAIAAQAPGYLITTEHYPGRRERFVAKAISPVVHPHLVMTDDLDELFVGLLGPAWECADHLVHGIHGGRRG
jgi:hypothetical protein